MAPESLRARACWALASLLIVSSAWSQTPSTAPWQRIASVPGGYIGRVVFDAAHPGVAIAGSDAAYLYRSTDGGATWKAMRVGTVNEGFRAIAFSPSTPGTAFAYSTDNFFAGFGTLYRSVDDGRTWQPTPGQPSSVAAGGFFPGEGREIVIDPTGRIIVLTDTYSGILRSADGGATWSNPVSNARAFGLSADPKHRGVLWAAGLDNTTGLSTVWKSADFGATWVAQTPAAFNPTGPIFLEAYGIVVQPRTGVIYATWTGFDPNTYSLDGGVVVSTDGGHTWISRNDGLLPSFSPGSSAGWIAFDPEDSDTIFVTTNGGGGQNGDGFYRSRNSGRTWEPIGTVLPVHGANGVWVRPEMRGYPAALFTATPGLYASTDDGHHWQHSDAGQVGGYIQMIADDDVASGGYYAASGDGLFRSTDGAATWNRIDTWDGPIGINAFGIDRNSPQHTLYAPSINHVWRSTTAGHSWSDVSPPVPPTTPYASFAFVLVDPNRADHLYVASSDGTLSYSPNGGRNWTSVQCGYGTAAFDGLSTSKVIRVPGSSGNLYLPLGSGLWVAAPDASSCVPAAVQPLPGGYITSMTVLGSDPAALLVSGYAASGPPLVMRSTDGGASFQAVDSLPAFPGTQPWNVASSPDRTLGAGSYFGDTVSISRDGGANWTTQPDVFFDISAGVSTMNITRHKVFWTDFSGAALVAPAAALH